MLGSRSVAKTALDTAAPVALINMKDMQTAGPLELGKLLVLVNVQQTIGRGSAGTDINAIPMSAIHHIEVLRDGAAAQYGSDAIAGAINNVLKSRTNETQLSTTESTTKEGAGDLVSGKLSGRYDPSRTSARSPGRSALRR